ncbi:MAG: electron transport complex subunit RsxC [Gammaproteobacteria bacterium]|jgi:electron transport complex protein RnfC|nr:electron transport complex subunit RsxC [Gammaproteobacteria bacterium]MBT3722795.1 electron transport complex subunit RsxC [Gammaproteobacteria bacterium]MBT4078754.1 electron transport complex subunit RsxC [Gammaproteobacteria bacterium]MBT4193452.1 electron transport complex subunit RsxC [Gammaproteobacteria bacterium]MBT4450369.1 electron transport complex subunit RsxC [Gammaproteobacteria bacterium]
MPNSVYSFHGGLHLDDHKSESLTQPLQIASFADELILKVSQHIGEPNTPVVTIGDRVKRGQLLAESSALVSAPVHAPTSGTIKAIENRSIAHASGQKAECFIIVPDGKDEAIDVEIRSAESTALDKAALLDQIRSAGIVGLGGAVFPTAAKLTTANQHGIKTLIINGAECEPYITCDDLLMQNYASIIFKGISYLQAILQPEKTIIGIEDNKPAAIKAMQQALTESSLSNITVTSIPTLYPSGGEKQLIKLLTGFEVHSSQLSFEIGILCQNVGTCAAISQAIDKSRPLTSRVVTVTGPGIKNPGNWFTPLGTPVSHLINLAGGYTIEKPKLIMGGPMMGLTLKSDQIPVVKATNTILVMDQQEQEIAQECIRCGRCTEVCPVQLLPQQLYWYSRTHQFNLTESYHLFDCIECGCCSAVCPSHIPLVQYYRFAKGEIWDQRRKTYKSDRSRKRHEFRDARVAKQKLLDEEKRKLKREALAKKKAAELAAKEKTEAESSNSQNADAVQAALERVKARKKAQQVDPKNTTDLTTDQQDQIDEADARREKNKVDDA